MGDEGFYEKDLCEEFKINYFRTLSLLNTKRRHQNLVYFCRPIK